MNKQTYYLIADIIQRYRTWIIVKDTELLVEMRILQDGVFNSHPGNGACADAL